MKTFATVGIFIWLLLNTGANAATVPRPDTPDWKEVDITRWTPGASGDLMNLLAPVYKGFPEAMEGHPVLKIDLKKIPGTAVITVRIVMNGLLDDSVAGEEVLAEVIRKGGVWVLKRLRKRWQCARGPQKGAWIGRFCP